MRLRKECEHGKYDAHSGMVPCPDAKPGSDYSCDIAHWASCPGGEFLPEGTLVIPRDAEGHWDLPFNSWIAVASVVGGISTLEDGADWAVKVFDALASQVGESE